MITLFTARGFDICCRVKGSQYRLDALFNIASILQMVGLASIAISYIQPILLENSEDTTAHQFLWAMAQTESRDSAIQLYKTLSLAGDLFAQHKLATLTQSGGKNKITRNFTPE